MEHFLHKVAAGITLGLTAAYLDAKYFIGDDLHAIKAFRAGQAKMARRVSADKVNNFYLLETLCTESPDDLFLIYQDQKFTYRNSVLRSLQWANYLLSIGVQKGEVVALNFSNKPALLFAQFGLWAIGAVPALIDYNLADRALVHCVKIADSRFLIYDHEYGGHVESAAKLLADSAVQIVPYGESAIATNDSSITEDRLSRQSSDKPSKIRRSGAVPTDTAALVYTSGSTGLPKAARVTWIKYLSGEMTAGLVGINKADRFYTCMPMYHGTAGVLGLSTCLNSGATLVLGHRFSNRTFWPEVSSNNVTVIQYVGEVARYLVAAPYKPEEIQHKVRMAYGNGMRQDSWEKFRNRFRVPLVAEFYASTEGVGGHFNVNSNDIGFGAVGRQGKLRRILDTATEIIRIDIDTEVEVRSKSGLCKLCKPNEPGEMLFKLQDQDPLRTFAGYHGDSIASQSKIIRNVKANGDSYLRMGDLMSRDLDGFVYFHDRLGDTFRWKGENVSTMEVAEVLNQFPGAAEINVYGVQLPNHDGRVGCAAIQLDSDGKIDLAAFAAQATAKLPKYAVPQFLRFVSKMDMTGNYKFQKGPLRKEGVDPAKTGNDKILWLKHGHYVLFTESDWRSLVAGQARL